jgi:hypothetical protein
MPDALELHDETRDPGEGVLIRLSYESEGLNESEVTNDWARIASAAGSSSNGAAMYRESAVPFGGLSASDEKTERFSSVNSLERWRFKARLGAPAVSV